MFDTSLNKQLSEELSSPGALLGDRGRDGAQSSSDFSVLVLALSFATELPPLSFRACYLNPQGPSPQARFGAAFFHLLLFSAEATCRHSGYIV